MAKLPRYLFPSDYMADPSANVFNGRLYVYPSHDWDAGECFDDDGGHFQMKDYHVLSWNDVENDEATDHGVILDVKDVPWSSIWVSLLQTSRKVLSFLRHSLSAVLSLSTPVCSRTMMERSTATSEVSGADSFSGGAPSIMALPLSLASMVMTMVSLTLDLLLITRHSSLRSLMHLPFPVMLSS